MTAMDAIERTLEKLTSDARPRRARGMVGAFSTPSGRPDWQADFLTAWYPFVPDHDPDQPDRDGAWKFEAALVPLIVGAARYADAHAERYESVIGDDGVLGPNFRDILIGIRGLLNGQLGRLDGGTLDHMLCTLADAAGVNLD